MAPLDITRIACIVFTYLTVGELPLLGKHLHAFLTPPPLLQPSPPPLLPPPCRCLHTWSYTGASKKLPVIMILMTHSIKALMSLRHKDPGKCGLHVERSDRGKETGRREVREKNGRVKRREEEDEQVETEV